MAITIDIEKAKKVANDAISKRKLVKDAIGKNISYILRAFHKTYRYVLVTELLAKATDERIDILSLQAQDESEGAYDARSVGHKVIVPIEREEFPFSLGNSNEPFLNNTARQPRLSLDNAVKGKNDREILKLCIDTLSQIKTSKDAFRYLCSAFSDMETISNEIQFKYSVEGINFDGNNHVQSILDYIYILTDEPKEGEICPLIIASIEQFYLGETYRVEPHKVNESGASPREVGDIDIFDSKKKLVSSIEVKDKDFAKEDVGHAIRKFMDAKLERSFFIYGKNVSWDKESVYQLVSRFGRIGHFCCVISVLNYSKMRLTHISDNITLKSFSEMMLRFAKQIKVYDETIDWIKNALIKMKLKTAVKNIQEGNKS